MNRETHEIIRQTLQPYGSHHYFKHHKQIIKNAHMYPIRYRISMAVK